MHYFRRRPTFPLLRSSKSRSPTSARMTRTASARLRDSLMRRTKSVEEKMVVTEDRRRPVLDDGDRDPKPDYRDTRHDERRKLHQSVYEETEGIEIETT